ncbi:MAG: hypothetical protein GW911_03730 [Armatimonadetes bacterium]|nr:hypothetical protein [Armatimonadota bacterium]NCO94739.1 hypothetical protein [Armatimonadota bacterium]NCP32357.1 hypothetical protein [Armatimonadota bacterium]NDK11151.1 hypothetical protein [Armatimonadota bacterium]
MPAKYHIHTHPAPPRVRPAGKLGIVDWREDCASCHNCVKRSCIYGLFRDEYDTLHEERGYLDYIYQCKGCLNCVQNCTKGILTRVLNPEYECLGDDYFTPNILLTTWFQSESGSIPISGSGYNGPFSGSGFDSMWTDMSEIVRPTRDGIHGREYINTGVDIGRKLDHLAFEDGKLAVSPPPLAEIPMPVIFEVLPRNWYRGSVGAATQEAAKALGLLAIVPVEDTPEGVDPKHERALPWATGADAAANEALTGAPIAMVSDCDDVMAVCASLKEKNPAQIVVIRVPANPAATERVLQLARDGAEVVHLVFDSHGREEAPEPRHARDVLREVHGALVKSLLRDQVTLIASGGIAMAEHVVKALICGADLVAIDLPLVIALECRLCLECERGELCQIALEEADLEYATHRLVNLMGAWHHQLIELMGAMGIREARRLRGETGRAMFFEDLERDSFGRLFGKRKEAGN